ncbi:MAG: glutathione S-transferase C-terminal domain-containing protein, partial [Litorivicinus sp.]
ALLVVYEGRMRDKGSQSAPWLAMQHQKITQTLDWFVDAPPVIDDQPSLAAIALAAALGYLDLRFEGVWRDSHPILVEWLAEFTRVMPAYEATKPRAAH